ncbi:chemotaxis protein CheV [Ancylobacter sp. MQZ15Z-1]|uniref:Chemotaxis protein CheV n=1 Tax=Ancylobacter mangrovi TaxID=2972472 RepID=A0A9X2T2P4_9HYPH|nr:chemotaxis protein CheV [Ancylobacter mangrovi]MCS0496400.1 chemotaxis protein CheV [Ancylobacter mangrovi]
MLVFSLHGMQFALPASRAINVMPLSGERWDRMARMAQAGTLGTSGLPLVRLSDRLGRAEAIGPGEGALVLFGTEGRVRATLLLDAMPQRVTAEVATLPADWRDRFAPCEDMIAGIARLADGSQAALLDMPMGIAAARPRVSVPCARDTAHLLVRAGRRELEAVRVAALRGMNPIDGRSGRMLLLLGGEGEAVAVDEVVGLAPAGRIERLGGERFLVTGETRYRLLEPGETVPSTTGAARVLLTAPQGPGRALMGDIVRSMGHDVSLADDPRAARLAGDRFDVVLVDLDAYELAGQMDGGRARRIGFTAGGHPPVPDGFDAVVPAGDGVALVAALLVRRARAA